MFWDRTGRKQKTCLHSESVILMARVLGAPRTYAFPPAAPMLPAKGTDPPGPARAQPVRIKTREQEVHPNLVFFACERFVHLTRQANSQPKSGMLGFVFQSALYNSERNRLITSALGDS